MVSSQALTTLLGYPAQVLAAVLPHLIELEDSRDVGHTAAISVDRVVAWAWNEGRLERATRLLAAGEKAPPIRVSRYWLHGEALYSVADGMHRTIAARQAGRQRIRAVIGSEVQCHPERYLIELATGRMWRAPEPGDRWLKMVSCDIAPEVAAALVAVGVRELVR